MKSSKQNKNQNSLDSSERRERRLVEMLLKEEEGCGVADLFLFELKFDNFVNSAQEKACLFW